MGEEFYLALSLPQLQNNVAIKTSEDLIKFSEYLGIELVPLPKNIDKTKIFKMEKIESDYVKCLYFLDIHISNYKDQKEVLKILAFWKGEIEFSLRNSILKRLEKEIEIILSNCPPRTILDPAYFKDYFFFNIIFDLNSIPNQIGRMN